MHGDVGISKTNRRDGIRDTQHNEGSKSSPSLGSCRIFVESGPHSLKPREALRLNGKCASSGGNHSRQLTIPYLKDHVEPWNSYLLLVGMEIILTLWSTV